MFEIRNDIPIPTHKGKVNKWPFGKMNVGECAIFEDPVLGTRAKAYCHSFGGIKGWRFKSQAIDGKVYVWRIS